MIYSVKMRASKLEDKKELHISGAERIVSEEYLDEILLSLKERALSHEKGVPNSINIKIENINEQEILNLKALKVREIDVLNLENGYKEIKYFLESKNVINPQKVIELIKNTSNMRGAMVLNIRTLERMEKDKARGVRVTYMDYSNYNKRTCKKDHFLEALALATKVANAPGIVGEVCISDDPNYIKGYVSSKEDGYVRITKLKKLGDEKGSRVFLYDPNLCEIEETIDFLENKKVLIHE